MISSLLISQHSRFAGPVSRSLVPPLFASRLDPIADTERIDRPDIEEYYRVRFDDVSLGGPPLSNTRARSPIELYLEVAAL